MKVTKRKVRSGSPLLGLGASFAVQLYQEDLALVERLARDERTSKGAVLRNLVKSALMAQKRRRVLTAAANG